MVLPKVSEILKSNLPYEFVAVGIVWTVVAVGLGLVIVLWPALTCYVAGLLLKFLPSERITSPWAISSAVLGLLVSAYQVYAAIPFISSTFSSVGVETMVGFLVFSLVHVTLLYFGYSPLGKPTE